MHNTCIDQTQPWFHLKRLLIYPNVFLNPTSKPEEIYANFFSWIISWTWWKQVLRLLTTKVNKCLPTVFVFCLLHAVQNSIKKAQCCSSSRIKKDHNSYKVSLLAYNSCGIQVWAHQTSNRSFFSIKLQRLTAYCLPWFCKSHAEIHTSWRPTSEEQGCNTGWCMARQLDEPGETKLLSSVQFHEWHRTSHR